MQDDQTPPQTRVKGVGRQFHDLLWKRCYLDFAATDTVLHFNQEKNLYDMIFPNMGLEVGQHLSSHNNYSNTNCMVGATKNTIFKIRQSKRLKRA